MVGMENTATAVVDDPDQQFYESYACDSDRNFTGYCNRAAGRGVPPAIAETDREKRRQLVWEIDAKLQQDGARPVIFHTARRDLLAAAGQRPDDDGQQHVQRVAAGRRLAGELGAHGQCDTRWNGSISAVEYGNWGAKLVIKAVVSGFCRNHASSVAMPLHMCSSLPGSLIGFERFDRDRRKSEAPDLTAELPLSDAYRCPAGKTLQLVGSSRPRGPT